MTMNVSLGGDIADLFDARAEWSSRLLDGWVEDANYSVTAMALASAVGSTMEFSRSFIDIGRFGNGVLIEKTWAGAGKDLLRGVSLVGPAGKLIGKVGRLLQETQAGNTCAWYALANSLKWSGQRFFVTADQLMHSVGLDAHLVDALRSISGWQAPSLQEALRRIGVSYRVITGQGKNLEDIVRIASENMNGIINFSVRFGSKGHRIYMKMSRTTGTQFVDPHNPRQVFRTLADLRKHLEAKFGPSISLSDSPILFIKNSVLVTLNEGAQIASKLAFALTPIIDIPAEDERSAKLTLDLTSSALSGLPVPSMTEYRVNPGDSLSKISQRFFGTYKKWPLIYAANARVVGRDPNRIKPGQFLRIPPATLH